MQSHGVELYFGVNYDETFKEKHKYDHVIRCEGSTYKSSFFNNSDLFSDCVNERG